MVITAGHPTITADHPAFRRADFDAAALLRRGRDGALARRLSGALMVLGYGDRWQNERLTCGRLPLVGWQRDRPPAGLVAELLVLVATVGDTRATPENSGQTQTQIDGAHAVGRRSHCHVPAAYNEHFDLLPEAAPRRPAQWTLSRPPLGVKRETQLAALDMLLREGISAPEIAVRLRASPHHVAAATLDIGLRTTAELNDGGVSIRPGQEALLAAVRTALHRADVLREDPIEVWDDLVEASRALRSAA